MNSEAKKSMSRDQLLWVYQRMTMIRIFEEKLKELIESGVPTGPVHLYIGEEAVAVGVCAALKDSDWISSTHRGHGHCIAKGVDVRKMMAEVYGKTTGTNRGKGGSMHITDFQVGMLGVNPIVGSGPTHAVGAALTSRVLGKDWVAAAFFGDGASNIGAIHEAMNLASIWKLGVLFVCENNFYADATPIEYTLAGGSIVNRAAGYGMPGIRVDGQDVFEVWEAAEAAVARARAGEGPTLIECTTYRYYGHHQSDNPLRYRTAEEEQEAHRRDCIKRFRDRVLSENLLGVSDLERIDAENQSLIQDAVAFAESSPLPQAAELYTNVFAPELS
jgi:pyruvate dehydrogenase E1 component alpha subunit